jgi:FAD/FMN-containing dehydrogenase
MASYVEKIARLQADIAAAPPGASARVGLAKSTSNLFRDRARRAAPRIDLKHFNRVVAFDPIAQTVETEGMTTYAEAVAAALAHGAMPCVVPQLKSITVGGAMAGVGIEATSFRHGLVHDTAVALEVLTGDGRVVICTADNEHRDLFFGFPNSYGTLGYALKLTMRTQPVTKFVQVEHARFSVASECFAALGRLGAQKDIDFLDGVVFGPREMYVSAGRFVDQAPYVSDYTFERIYYHSLRERSTDFLTTEGYLWRWDTDWFWCSKNVGAQHPLLRRLYGRKRLNSVTYQRIMRWNSRWGLTRRLNRLRGLHTESVIQDVDVPLERSAEFLEFLHAEIGILPIWLCPIRAPDPEAVFTLYPLTPGATYVNFGFWDVVASRDRRPAGFCNRSIERKVRELGGIKSLYSDSYVSEEEFWAIYNRPAYEALKERYDPSGTLGDLYAKTVLRA